MTTTFTVAQERGGDTVVTVTTETRKDWPEDREYLLFETDQSLTTQSGRAWNVNEAIKSYCRARGYRINETTRRNVTAVYHPESHSQVGWYNIIMATKADPRYKASQTECEHRRDEINQVYGGTIAQLRNLIRNLESRNDALLNELNAQLIETQLHILTDIEIPAHVQGIDRKRLEQPSYPIDQMKSSNYYSLDSQGRDILPADLAPILALLDE